MSRKSGEFALIHWQSSGTTDIIPCGLIKPADREEDKIIRLLWHDRINGGRKWYNAKILKMNKSKQTLEKIIVNTKGQIINNSEKAFSSELMIQRESSRKKQNKNNKLKYGNCLALEEEITNKQSIFTENHSNNTKNHFSLQHLDRDITYNIENSDENDFSEENQTDSEDSYTNKSHSKEERRNKEKESTEDNEQIYRESHGVFIIPDVTIEQINFQKRILASMQYSFDLKLKSKLHEEVAKITNELLTSTIDKVEIFTNSKVYMSKTRFNIINLKYENHNDWKKLVSEILVDIYGENLKYLTAKGSRGTTGINTNLFTAIYNLINSKINGILEEKLYIKHINKLCANRKTYKKK